MRNPDRIPGQEMLLAYIELEPQKILEEKITLDILWDRLDSSNTSFPSLVEHVKVETAKVLPTYMCPLAYISIKTLPFTNSYKLNRGALKELANHLSAAKIQKVVSMRGASEQRPLTQEEQTLRNVWAGALKMDAESLDVRDDFFSVGGVSLKAMAVVSAARRNGLHLSVALIYKYRTIESIVSSSGQHEVHSNTHNQAFSLLDVKHKEQILERAVQQCATKAELIQDIIPVTDMQEFYLANQKLHAQSWMIRCAFDLPTGLDSERLKRAWEQLMAHYPITRTRFIHSEHGFFQVVLDSEVIRWLPDTSSFPSLDRALDEENLGFGLQPHASALLLGADRMPARLIWFVNHAISDQLMNEHVSQDLAALYADQTYSHPARPSFKSAIESRLTKPSSTSFWRSHLSGAYYKAPFKGSQLSSELANGHLILDTEVSVPSLKSSTFKVSEYSLVITALSLALARETNSKDIPFLLMRSGRVTQLPGAEDIVGPLLARAPLRVSIPNTSGEALGGMVNGDQKSGLLALLQRVQSDFEACSSHEIVSERAFQDAVREAADHLAYAYVLNFTPPVAALTVDSMGAGRECEPTRQWTYFPVDNDRRDGVGHKNRILDFFGEISNGRLDLHVIWQENAITQESIQRVLTGAEKALRLLEAGDERITVGHFMEG